MKTVIPCLAALCLAACAANSGPAVAPRDARGDVFYSSLDAPAEDRYRLREEEDFRLGSVRPDTRVVPGYPENWLPRAPREAWICTELHIDEHGAVFNTRAVHVDGCNGADTAWDADFRAAVDTAVRQWSFEPSYRCTRPPGAPADHECPDAAHRVAVPVSRAFRFVFRVTKRGGVVEGGETPP